MKISFHKTKAMTISIEPLECKLKIDGRIVEQVMKLSNLSANFATLGNLVKEISKSVWLFNLSYLDKQIYEKGNKIKYIYIYIYIYIYKATVCPIMTYALETRTKA